MEKQKSLFDQATMAMERISRELRDASTITTATGSTLEFTKSHGSPEETTIYDITFQLSGTTLQRVGTTTVNFADNVSTFDVTRVTPAPPPDREEITITLTLEEGAANITLRSYICPKNLAYPDEEKPSGRNLGGHWQENFQ